MQVLPHFVEIFAGWQPLQEPERGVGDLLAWRDLLEDPAQRDAIFQVHARPPAKTGRLSLALCPSVVPPPCCQPTASIFIIFA